MQDASTLATAHYPETLDRIFVSGTPFEHEMKFLTENRSLALRPSSLQSGAGLRNGLIPSPRPKSSSSPITK
jgi:hypothetical protein